MAPDKRTCCDSIPEALEIAGITAVPKRQLSKQEIEEAMKEAKARGLPGAFFLILSIIRSVRMFSHAMLGKLLNVAFTICWIDCHYNSLS